MREKHLCVRSICPCYFSNTVDIADKGSGIAIVLSTSSFSFRLSHLHPQLRFTPSNPPTRSLCPPLFLSLSLFPLSLSTCSENGICCVPVQQSTSFEARHRLSVEVGVIKMIVGVFVPLRPLHTPQNNYQTTKSLCCCASRKQSGLSPIPPPPDIQFLVLQNFKILPTVSLSLIL